MNASTRVITSACVILLVSLPVFAQTTTGSLTATVTHQGAALPGVTVTISSPALQGTRNAISNSEGDVNFPALPPGRYTVTFEKDGMSTVTDETLLGLARTEHIVATLVAEGTPPIEEIVVTEKRNSASLLDGIQANIDAETVESLPLDRTIESAVSLAPNVHFTGLDNRISISGAIAVESLFLVNGVVINDDFTGHSPLYIEDAIQETVTTSGALSVEYGRFSGGVVNAITKSGGDDFSGSFRTRFENDSWRETTPLGEGKANETNLTYEATFGGPILQDRLWFFTAGRLTSPKEARETSVTNVPYDFVYDERRFEAKLTYSPNDQHSIGASYTRRDEEVTNTTVPWPVMDLASLGSETWEEELIALHHTGRLTGNLSIQGQLTARRLTLEDVGSPFMDLARGTPFFDHSRANSPGNGYIFGSTWFCRDCSDRPRTSDDEALRLEGNYFLSTRRTGSHELIFGAETFRAQLFENNYQTGSGYFIDVPSSIVRGRQVFPVVIPSQTVVVHAPILEESRGNDFRTHSAFFADRIRLNEQWSLNLGLRYDRNRGRDSLGNRVADDDSWSPRLRIAFDPLADGRWTISAGYGKYVASLYSPNADLAGGRQAYIIYLYLGPSINADENASTESLVPPDEALGTIFAWFFANEAPLLGAWGSGIASRLDGTLDSPHVKEWTLGLSRSLRSRGFLRLDAMYRKWGDFYAERVDLTTGQVTNEYGTFDLRLIENSNDVERQYTSVSLQGNVRLTPHLELAGSWTVSKAEGNFLGEVAGRPANLSDTRYYPEYKDPAWNSPKGDLPVDRRHRARLWLTYNTPIPSAFGVLDVSLLQTYLSGSPYGAVASINTGPYIENPGYENQQTFNPSYFFTDRDAFRTDAITSTDLALNYSYALRFGVTFFVQAHVLNLFNESGIEDVDHINRGVLTYPSSSNLIPFDPFNETPVRGVHWDLDPNFGEPVDHLAYQTPRTYRFSAGVRF